MQLSFRLDKRPGESHLALDGKKRSRGSWLGGALVSALCICCFLAHRLLYGTLWFVVSLLFYIAIPIPEVIQCYHLFLHFPIAYELIS